MSGRESLHWSDFAEPSGGWSGRAFAALGVGLQSLDRYTNCGCVGGYGLGNDA